MFLKRSINLQVNPFYSLILVFVAPKDIKINVKKVASVRLFIPSIAVALWFFLAEVK